MFVILLNYKVPIEKIDEHVVAHRQYLDEGYKKNYFVTSGPRIPRSGGVIISQLKDRVEIDNILKNDPFKIYDLADYEIIEFTPLKYHQDFSLFI